MSGEIINEGRVPHDCKPPEGRHNLGAVWRCDCGKEWVYESPVRWPDRTDPVLLWIYREPKLQRSQSWLARWWRGER